MPNARPWPGPLVASLAALLLLAATAGCDGASFNANYAPGFTPGAAHPGVSILGVFREGRFSQESWGILGAPISASLGQPLCETGFGDKLQRADPELYARIDEDVRANGVTDELLAQLASKTDGELLVTLSVLGRVDLARVAAEGPETPAVGTGARNAPVGGGRTRGRTRGPSAGRVEFNGLELSASLFSVKQRRSVGRLSMRYAGTSLDEALKLFAARLGAELPGSPCRPWSWSERPPR